MARYSQEYKDRAVARLLPPENALVAQVSRELGVSEATLERWRAQSLAEPSSARTWTAAARLEAVLTTAALNEVERAAWCREKGLFVSDLDTWRSSATAALAGPDERRATPSETRQDQRRIKELERELRRKDKALAEAAALLVLSKKMQALFHADGDA
jgi:transposase-like protein